MSNGERAANLRKHIFSKDVRDRSHGLMDAGSEAIGGDDPRRLLTAVLQCEQAVESEVRRGEPRSEGTEDATGLFRFVVVSVAVAVVVGIPHVLILAHPPRQGCCPARRRGGE